MPDSNREILNAAAQARFGLDLNGALRAATGLPYDANGISKFLFGGDINKNHDGMLSLLRGGLLLDGTATSFAETPDVAALDILGDIDIRAEFVLTGLVLGAQNLLAKWTPAAQQSYRMALVPLFSFVSLTTSSTGANSVDNSLAAFVGAEGRYGARRVTLDVDNGAAGRTARFYSAPSLDGPWTEQAGSPLITGVVTSIFNSSSVLRLGALGNGTEVFSGRIHRVEIRNGIDGTVVANPDFRNLTAGTTGFTDGAGRVWSLGAGARVV